MFFNEKVDPIYIQIEQLRKRIVNLRKTRDLLLIKLINGGVDVEVLDIIRRTTNGRVLRRLPYRTTCTEIFKSLGYDYLNCYNESFAKDGTLGRETASEVILFRVSKMLS